MPTSKNDLFFTSDWHLGHANVLKYSNRPFENVDQMARVLIKRYNSRVGKNSTCYFLGDMGLCNPDYTKRVLEQLNGTKILILGNHDRGRRAMKAMGFDAVMNMSSIVVANQVVTMTHMPLRGIKREDTTGMRGVSPEDNFHGENRPKSKQFSIPNWGQFHLSGHIHSPNGGRSKTILGRQMDVGVDAHNYTPVSLSQIESWVIKTLQEEENK